MNKSIIITNPGVRTAGQSEIIVIAARDEIMRLTPDADRSLLFQKTAAGRFLNQQNVSYDCKIFFITQMKEIGIELTVTSTYCNLTDDDFVYLLMLDAADYVIVKDGDSEALERACETMSEKMSK